MLVQATTGFENFQNGGAKAHLFVVPTQRFPGKELHIGIAARSGGVVRQIGFPQTIPAAPGMRPEMGQWTQGNYEVPEGMVLKAFAHRSGGFGTMRVQASMFLRMREQAAYRRIGTILTGNPKASYTRVWIEGRFDILTLAQAREHGINVPTHFSHSFDTTMTSRAFDIIEVESEVAAAPQQQVAMVVNAQGEEVQVRTVRRNRALEL